MSISSGEITIFELEIYANVKYRNKIISPLTILLLLLLTFDSMAQTVDEEEDFTMLTAYRDFLSQATDFSLSFIRYRHRGYDNRLRQLRWNGVRLKDWEEGRIPWGISGRLSALNTNQGSDHLITHVEDQKEGFKISSSFSNRTYTGRISAQGVHRIKRGWKSMIEVTARGGESLAIDGISAKSYSLFTTLAHTTDNHSFEVSLLYAPTTRTTQRASTLEGYQLSENNLYNSAWGRQAGKKRSIRENRLSQPVVVARYNTQLTSKIKLNISASARVGMEYRTGLSWQNTPNPYPDYYRYMPSYQTDPEDRAMIEEAWHTDESVRQIDFQNLYNINGYTQGGAKYIVEQRRRNLQQYSLMGSIEGRVLSGGFELSYGKNRNYKKIADLLGAEYWLDIDAWVENDDDIKDQVQSNLRNPNFKAKVGDKFGYDYMMTMQRSLVWIELQRKWGNFEGRLYGEIEALRYQREGHFEKENFDGNNSYGKSAIIKNYDYRVIAEGWYNHGGRFRGGVTLDYRTLSSSPSQLFISREFRNATLPQSIPERILTVELTGDYRTPNFKLKGSIYLTKIKDRTELHKFYDDNVYRYTHYWLKGVDQRYAGVELSSEFRILENLEGAVAAIFSDNRYSSNPTATQWDETQGRELRSSEQVYYNNMRVSGSPQTLFVTSIRYNPKLYHISLTANYFSHNYISISPLRRTDRSQSTINKTTQERLSSGVTLDLFAGRTFYFQSGRSLGIWVGLNNILNRRDILTGGYESYRTVNSAASDSRYYYALGFNGFVSVNFQF